MMSKEHIDPNRVTVKHFGLTYSKNEAGCYVK